MNSGLQQRFGRMGAKIGTNTLIDPNVLIYEADLLEIGDNCRIEEETTLLCHKFNVMVD
jgi:UDP-3-O-[3-hydroxymyristoyl] glucosamine N-acyltransferase